MDDFNKNFNDFRKNISLTDLDKNNLMRARKNIRGTIRKTFNDAPTRYFTDEIKGVLAGLSKNTGAKIKPQFMTQGSFVYNTINKPERPPSQQMDLDDGVYLPLSYIDNQSENFQHAAKIIKGIIRDCVSDLCSVKGWKLETNHSKCLRIVINDISHIDLPIYSTPDNQIGTIQDRVVFLEMESLDRFLFWSQAKDVLLATDNGWIKSDPREIHEWVKDTKENYGNNFIHYSRYLKAWRDHQWDNSKFSSIMIMAGIAQVLSERGYSKNENVALDLVAIAISLKLYLSNGGIKHPTESGRMDKELSSRDEIIKKLHALAINLSEATKTNNTQLLIDCFGVRFPNIKGSGSKIGATVALAPAPAIASTPIKQYRQC